MQDELPTNHLLSIQKEMILLKMSAKTSQTVTFLKHPTMFERGCNFPIVRRVTLRRSGKFTVDAMYDESAVESYGYPKGASKAIAQFNINAPADTDCKIRVNVKQDIHGSLTLSSAQMVEEIIEEEPPAPAEEGVETKAAEGDETKVAVDDTPKETVAKKPKLKKTNLEFSIVRPLDWTDAELQKEIEVEVDMSNGDRVVKETADARNELESYIYDMRDKIISESQLASYCTEAEKTTFLPSSNHMKIGCTKMGCSVTLLRIVSTKPAHLQ